MGIFVEALPPGHGKAGPHAAFPDDVDLLRMQSRELGGPSHPMVQQLLGVHHHRGSRWVPPGEQIPGHDRLLQAHRQ